MRGTPWRRRCTAGCSAGSSTASVRSSSQAARPQNGSLLFVCFLFVFLIFIFLFLFLFFINSVKCVICCIVYSYCCIFCFCFLIWERDVALWLERSLMVRWVVGSIPRG